MQNSVETCGFSICELIITICQFADCTAHLRNLRICDSGMSPRIFGFAICGQYKNFACPPLVSAVPIPFALGEIGTIPHTDFNPNTNSSILLQYKQDPSPHQATPNMQVLNIHGFVNICTYMVPKS